MNRIENLMTTRELAEAWNVSVKTVQRAAKKLFDPSTVQTRVVNGGETMAFNELQATLLHDEITGHHNLHSRDIENATSELEEEEIHIDSVQISRWIRKRRWPQTDNM